MIRKPLTEEEKNKLLETEDILKEKQHWKDEGEKFLNSERYLKTLLEMKK
jgi:hypothetical protein